MAESTKGRNAFRRQAGLPVSPRYPALLQINARVWLRRLSDLAGRRIDLDRVPDREINAWANAGFDWIWLLSAWDTGEIGRTIARSDERLQEEIHRVLPDWTEKDLCGSGFAIASYTVSRSLGGASALARFRERLARRGIRLMLDFVSNHTALDHPWVREHPAFYVEGEEKDLAREPGNYARIDTDQGEKILAHGRDPNFPGWSDTLQLDYANPEMRNALTETLLSVAEQCDGLRCDMAMLIVPEVFDRTWGRAIKPFWPTAIESVRSRHPEFVFLAEVYWDMEWALQRQGFDYCYDKRLYDRLRTGKARAVCDHLAAGLAYQDRLARFLENHDEARAAAVFPGAMGKAAAVATHFAPGLRFFHDGQMLGATIRIPIQLCRGPDEPTDEAVLSFYRRLLAVLKDDRFRNGDWQQLKPVSAWPGNPTHADFLAYSWIGTDASQTLVVVNFSEHRGQCRIPLPLPEWRNREILIRDMLGSEGYKRSVAEMRSPGLFIDLPEWGSNVFDFAKDYGEKM